MALFIRPKIIKNKNVYVYKINTLWFEFDFDSQWWTNTMNNINTKILM